MNDDEMLTMLLTNFKEQFKPLIARITHSLSSNSLKLIFDTPENFVLFSYFQAESHWDIKLNILDVSVEDGVVHLKHLSTKCIADLSEPNSLDKIDCFIQKVKENMQSNCKNNDGQFER